MPPARRPPPSSPRFDLLALAMTIVLLLMTRSTLVLAATPVAKVCKKSCVSAAKTCRLDARATHDVTVALCPTKGPEKKACRLQPKRVHTGAKRSCKAFKKACTACCKAGEADCDRPPEPLIVAGTFEVPPRVTADNIGLPPAPNGSGFVLLRLPDGDLVIDPAKRTPISAAAECAAAVLACYQAGARNFPGCLAAVPPCTSKKPWEKDKPVCCAPACIDRYQELRRAGRDEATAFAAAIWEEPSCMPGLHGHVPEPVP